MAKKECRHGYELGPGNRCTKIKKKKGTDKTKTLKKAEIAARVIAAPLSFGLSEAAFLAKDVFENPKRIKRKKVTPSTVSKRHAPK
tara:strand:+ start:220 stop:477 length:258 start_codon:yes stop_codon:yes gene_type:complete